jgi:Dolichyl-phosphate-mannose-protein mannosyltransferase
MLQSKGEVLREPGETTQRQRADALGAIKTTARRLYFGWLIPVSLVVGLFLRTREWLFDRSLWLDELMVTFSITHRGFTGLLHPLSVNQAAPIGWLWAERASIDLFGTNDMALRVPCWAASLVALGVFPLMARQLVGRSAVPAATLIFATSPELIYYAADTKQYSFDVACAVLAVLVTAKLAQRRPTMLTAVTWGLICAVLIWCSQPAIPICAVCGLVLLVVWFRELDTLLPVVVGGVILGISIALDWAVTLKPQSANVTLVTDWRTVGGYPPLNQTFSADIHWLRAAVTTTEQFLNISKPFLALGLMACGLIVVALSRRRFQGLLLALPMAAAVALGVTDHYPFARRLALYLYPIIVVLLAAPLALSDRPWSPRARWWKPAAVVASAAALITVAAPGIALGLDKAAHPDVSATGRQAVAFVGQHEHPGDLVLDLPGPASLTVGFYGPHDHVQQGGLFGLSLSPNRGGTCPDPFSQLHGVTRVWLVFTEFSIGQPPNRNQIARSYMDAYGRPVLSYTGLQGAGAYLFDLSKPAASEPVAAIASAPSYCLTIRLGRS